MLDCPGAHHCWFCNSVNQRRPGGGGGTGYRTGALPEVFGGGPCAAFEPQEIALHAAPADGKPIASIRVDKNWSFAPHGGCDGLEVSVHRGAAKEELPTREFDYEMPGAIALDRRDGWIKIRLHDGAGWFKPSVVDRFMPLSISTRNSSAYIDQQVL